MHLLVLHCGDYVQKLCHHVPCQPPGLTCVARQKSQNRTTRFARSTLQLPSLRPASLTRENTCFTHQGSQNRTTRFVISTLRLPFAQSASLLIWRTCWEITKHILREFVLNSRHLGPRRVEGWFRAAGRTPFPLDPVANSKTSLFSNPSTISVQ